MEFPYNMNYDESKKNKDIISEFIRLLTRCKRDLNGLTREIVIEMVCFTNSYLR